MYEEWVMPPFKLTLRRMYPSRDIYELIIGSDRYGHDVYGEIALIQGKAAALARFEEEKQRVMVRVAKIAMGLA